MEIFYLRIIKNEIIEMWSFKIPISPSKAGTTTSVTLSFFKKDFSGLTISKLNWLQRFRNGRNNASTCTKRHRWGIY